MVCFGRTPRYPWGEDIKLSTKSFRGGVAREVMGTIVARI